MKGLCEQAGVNPKKVFPHNLRHLFARVFYGIEKDIAKLADILGHSSINTTRIYIISTGNEHRKRMENMRLILWKKPPEPAAEYINSIMLQMGIPNSFYWCHYIMAAKKLQAIQRRKVWFLRDIVKKKQHE